MITITVNKQHLRLLARWSGVVAWFVGVLPMLIWALLDVTFMLHITYWQVLIPFLLIYYLLLTVYRIYSVGDAAERQQAQPATTHSRQDGFVPKTGAGVYS